MKRPDLCNREIAENWLGGMSQFALSIKYSCSPNTISARLRAARGEHPDLPWDERKAPAEKTEGAVKDYIRMNDGRLGESAIRQGSVIKSSVMRRR